MTLYLVLMACRKIKIGGAEHVCSKGQAFAPIFEKRSDAEEFAGNGFEIVELVTREGEA